jgi:uncharacterized RDD family membrane protein YckC
MQGLMNAFAQTSARPVSGSKLDNRRILAALIDLAIVGVGGAAVLVAAGVLGGDGASLGAPLAAVVVGWALYYYFACESGGGQTVGKRLMRLRVVRADGSPADMKAVAVRTVLRVVDTALVGLIAMMATGERRARLGDLAAGTMIVSTDAAPAVVAPAAAEVAVTDDEPEPIVGEPWEIEPDEAAGGYEPITGEQPAEPEPLDIATPTLKELAQDVAAAAGSERAAESAPEPVVGVAPEPVVEVAPPAPQPEPVVEVARPAPQPEPRPLAEVEIGGPEIDVHDPELTVRSVDTVSAIDLVMGADDPSEDRPAADSPPAGA